MKPISVKALQYFAGRVCTIFVTGQFQRLFSDQQFNDYFVGIVDWINEDGVMTTHPVTKCKNYYALADIAAICEEQMLDPSDPEQAELIEKLKEQKVVPPMAPEVPQTADPFADIDLMASLARQAADLEEKKKRK